MTDILFLKSYYESVQQKLNENGFAVDHLFFVRAETELVTEIKDLPAGAFLMAIVIPSSDTRAQNIDNIKESETWLVYTLEKSDRKGITQQTKLESVALQQRIITMVKRIMREDIYSSVIPCNIRPDLNSMHSDPEFNYMGCEGYSLSFKVDSDDFFTSNNILP